MMTDYTVRLSALLLEAYQNAAARLQLPVAAVPRPGQYLHVHDPANPLETLATPLFAAGWPDVMEGEPAGQNQTLLDVASPLPESWQPGSLLRARGPLGRGFSLPPQLRRLALAAAGRNAARLLPLAAQAAEVAIFCDAPLSADLPQHIEVQPLSALPSALAWADFIALDWPPEALDALPAALGLQEPARRSLQGQALIVPPMPCGGLAQCGVCTLNTHSGPRSGARLACSHGPVFELGELV